MQIISVVPSKRHKLGFGYKTTATVQSYLMTLLDPDVDDGIVFPHVRQQCDTPTGARLNSSLQLVNTTHHLILCTLYAD